MSHAVGEVLIPAIFLNEDKGPQKNLNELGSDHELMDWEKTPRWEGRKIRKAS